MTVLKTDRIELRPFSPGDAKAVLDYASDPQWARYISQDVAPDEFDAADAGVFVGRALTPEGQQATSFAICRTGNVIGSIHLVMTPGDTMAELACLIARNEWGNGIAVEAAHLVLCYAFESLQLVRVFARADARNAQSLRVMEKLGMQQEARLRAHRIDRSGVRCDEVVFGLLRSDWEQCHG